jgi:hypothetical protein
LSIVMFQFLLLKPFQSISSVTLSITINPMDIFQS